MKFTRNQIILILAIIIVIGFIYRRRTEGYDREEAKRNLIKYVELHEVPEMKFVFGFLDGIEGLSGQQRTEIMIEADKGDEGDKTKLIDMIKKI